MNIDHIFVCPGSAGYEFSPSDRRIDARLLELLSPSSNELQESGELVPILRADWLRSEWFLPKKTVVAMAGLRARLPESAIQRGSGSVWAVATVIPVRISPSRATLAPYLGDLVKRLKSGIFEEDKTEHFSNRTHLELRSFGLPILQTAIDRLKNMVESGEIQGAFQRALSRAPTET